MPLSMPVTKLKKALIRSSSVLGVIPMGSGNGFARHFGLPLSVKRSLKVLTRGKIKPVDVGYVNDRPFFCTTGMGFDAETGYFFSRYDKHGFLSYALSFFRVFRDYRPVSYEIDINGERRHFEAFFINIANISQFGYHFYVAPKASTEDGFLDLVVVSRFPKWKGTFLAIRSYFGTIHKSRYVYHEKADDIKLVFPAGRKTIHIDGDPDFAEGTVYYRLEPAALKVILP
jgi:diacylglycerol kinase (ATP)